MRRAIANFARTYGRFWYWHLFRWQFWLVCCGIVLVMKVILGRLYGPTYSMLVWRHHSPLSGNFWLWQIADGFALATIYALIGGLAARLSFRWRNRKGRQ